jgi:hydrogenase maturation protease
VSAPRVLVAGIGNIFFGDDAFGVEVAQRLLRCELPAAVKVQDFGIRGLHLAYELLDGYDTLVLVDALPMGEPPGTVAVIEPELQVAQREEIGAPIEAHSMSPAVVLSLMSGLGATVGRVLIVGCQPEVVDEGIGLSPSVADAVDAGVTAVREVLDEIGVTAGKES